jgi:PII-like signaling protein
VNDDTYLKLTAYFGERQRAGSRFLAEAMLDVYAEREVATSVMLRGIASFGPRHVIRSDESLTLSEDPPVAVAAVDTAATIGDLVNDVVGMTTHGLITLERARLHSGKLSAAPLPEGDDAVKLTIYIGRRRRINGEAAFYAVCELLHRHHFAGATVFLGVDGTAHGRRRRARFFGANTDVPIMILAVGTAAQTQAALPELESMLDKPLVTVERVQVCKFDGQLLNRPPALPTVDARGRELRQKLMIHTDESTHHDGAPIHRALVRRLWESQTVSGATVLRGIWGFHGDHKPHGDKLIQYGRQVPVATIVVDTPEVIAQCFDIIDEVTGRHGLVTSEMVPALLMLDGDVRSGATDLADYRY